MVNALSHINQHSINFVLYMSMRIRSENVTMDEFRESMGFDENQEYSMVDRTEVAHALVVGEHDGYADGPILKAELA
jgi:hypothetical protein